MQAWSTNPFIMTQKDGYLLGRGTSDNKGPILAMLFAVKELLDQREGEDCAGLPCNLSFIFEVRGSRSHPPKLLSLFVAWSLCTKLMHCGACHDAARSWHVACCRVRRR